GVSSHKHHSIKALQDWLHPLLYESGPRRLLPSIKEYVVNFQPITYIKGFALTQLRTTFSASVLIHLFGVQYAQARASRQDELDGAVGRTASANCPPSTSARRLLYGPCCASTFYFNSGPA